MTVHRPQRFNKHTTIWQIRGNNNSTSTQIHCICVLVESLMTVIGHVFVCLLNRCCLWSVMYQAYKYMTDHRQQRFNKDTNTWPITGHNDSTSRQIHDRSQATTIPLADKYMTDNRPQLFNMHTNTWTITGNNDSTRKQISLLPVIDHVFVCLLNRCGLLSVMYLSANGIVVACDLSCICLLMESLLQQRFNKHTYTWQITGPQSTTIPLAEKCMTDHRPQGFNKHRTCICVLVESLWPVSSNVFVC
jgi:hypothetical protein